ncbi:MAG: 1-(5-phosphoribosyl)-5-[(5-phosphoribosylamino)methylideneamino] imidazole-4-carboxamide isomerase [Pseudomonadota bacterium]
MIILPSIDIRDGQCVRLKYGDYDQETRYDVDPIRLAQRYEALGLSQLHVVDLDGALEGCPVNLETWASIADATTLTLQCGGGIRNESHVRALLDVGVQRVVIGSLAITQPELVASWLELFGSERIVLALDVRRDEAGVARICTNAWQDTSNETLEDTIERFLPHGLQYILCTDIGRDGALQGPAIALYAALMARYGALSIQASGGVSDVADLVKLRVTGVAAAITGKALLEGRITDEEIRSF